MDDNGPLFFIFNAIAIDYLATQGIKASADTLLTELPPNIPALAPEGWRKRFAFLFYTLHIDGIMQERRNASALEMGLRLSCTNPSI